MRVLQRRRFPSITLSAHSGVQALSILSLFSGFDGFSCVLLSLGIVHAGIFFWSKAERILFPLTLWLETGPNQQIS